MASALSSSVAGHSAIREGDAAPLLRPFGAGSAIVRGADANVVQPDSHVPSLSGANSKQTIGTPLLFSPLEECGETNTKRTFANGLFD